MPESRLGPRRVSWVESELMTPPLQSPLRPVAGLSRPVRCTHRRVLHQCPRCHAGGMFTLKLLTRTPRATDHRYLMSRTALAYSRVPDIGSREPRNRVA